jgi:hypothetical protein
LFNSLPLCQKVIEQHRGCHPTDPAMAEYSHGGSAGGSSGLFEIFPPSKSLDNLWLVAAIIRALEDLGYPSQVKNIHLPEGGAEA